MVVKLDSARRKLLRGTEHLMDLQKEFSLWSAMRPYDIVSKPNGDMTEHVLQFMLEQSPDYTRWALMAGDIAHNMRSALDHVVAATLRTGADERVSEFPIFKDRVEFFRLDRKKSKPGRGSGLSKIAGIECAALRDYIERQQPYNRSNPANANVLWILHQFDAIDKHRLIHVVLLAPDVMEATYQIEWIGDPSNTNPYQAVWSSSPLEHESPIVTIIADSPMRNVKGNYKLSFRVSFDEAPMKITVPHAYPGLLETLYEFGEEVSRIIGQAEKILTDASSE